MYVKAKTTEHVSW